MHRNNQNFDLFISLGSACFCTQALRSSSLQFQSYPFDWLAGANFLDRAKIITSDFEDWLKKEYLEYVGEREHPEPKKIFRNTKTDITFNHDFSIDEELDKSYPQVKEKYDRRINRLINNIKNSNRVLLVYCELPGTDNAVDDDTLIQGYNLLKEKFPYTDIHILYGINLPQIKYKKRIEIKITNNITRFGFDYNAYNPEEPLLVNKDKLSQYFTKYSITTKFLTKQNIKQRRLEKIQKFLQQIICTKNNKNHKCITIFGIKISIRRKKTIPA